jgi:hypothetical protein
VDTSTTESRIGLATLIVAVIAAIAAVFVVPEFRKAFHLDSDPPPSSSRPPAAPPVTKDPPIYKLLPAPTPQVKGGDHNSPAVGTITQGPGSIAQIGGQGNQATIIGTIEPAPRMLTPFDAKNLSDAVRSHPSRVLVLYTMNDGEAYKFAQQIADALVGGGWTLKEPVSAAMMLREGGGPLYGMMLAYKGDSVPPGQRVVLNMSAAWGNLTNQLYKDFPDDFVVQPVPSSEDDLIVLSVYTNPKARKP